MKEDAFLSGLVLVIGATGTVGRELLQRLQLGGQRIRAAAREPAVTPDLRDILRREPTSFAQFAGDYARQWGAKQRS